MTKPEAERGWRFVAGLDLGIRHDHSALVVLGTRVGSHRIRLAQCETWVPPRGGQVDLIAVQRAVARAHELFHLRGVHCDPHRAELMAQQLRRRGVPMQAVPFAGQQLNVMAETMMETFRARIIDLYSLAGSD
jgi:phage terminase large subunit-like protein